MDSLTSSLTFKILVLFCTFAAAVAANQDFKKDCTPLRCSKDGPLVRYPFRLTSHASYCGYDKLVLSCSGNNTVLHLPSSGAFNVLSINYKKAYLTVTRDSWTPCPWLHMADLNVAGSPFSFNSDTISVFWLNCTASIKDASQYTDLAGPISCLGSQGHFIYVAYYLFELDLLPSTCTKMRNDSIFLNPYVSDGKYLPDDKFQDEVEETNVRPSVGLFWQDNLINCTVCEKKGHHCAFNTAMKRSVCASKDSHVVLIAGISFGALCILFGVCLYFYISRQSKRKRITRHKIELFLRNYKVMNPTRYTYVELMKITNGLKKKTGNGGFGTVYVGKLPSGIPVAVKVLDRSSGNGDLFINEVATMGRIHHVNIVRVLGFCYEGQKRAILYEFMENGSLDKYIFSSKGRSRQFSMERLLAIAMGVAEGIEYLHQGCDDRILHFDIKPHNILMDHKFVPKISDFGLSKLCPKDKSYVTTSAARGTMGYLAPEMYSRNFGTVSCKSDVYSFGMLVLEMISGRKNSEPLRDGDTEVYFPEWIYDQLLQGKKLCSSNDTPCDEEIMQKLAIVASWCIQWNPEDRPSMTKVVQMLGETLQNLQVPPKPVVSRLYHDSSLEQISIQST